MVLSQLDYDKQFILETDVCNSGIGAILSQEQGDDVVPIAFASRRLLPAESNYSISVKEYLAMLWGMEHFRYFLYGNEFIAVTDRKALEALNRGEIKSLNFNVGLIN